MPTTRRAALAEKDGADANASAAKKNASKLSSKRLRKIEVKRPREKAKEGAKKAKHQSEDELEDDLADDPSDSSDFIVHDTDDSDGSDSSGRDSVRQAAGSRSPHGSAGRARYQNTTAHPAGTTGKQILTLVR